MRPRHLVVLFRLALLTAVAASAALVVDYKNAGDPAFCGVASGCFAVRVSGYSAIFGIPLPNLGLAAFASLLALSLLARTPAHHVVLAALAVLGGLAATALLAVQAFVIQELCVYCTAVDLAAIVAAGAAVLIAWQAGALVPAAWGPTEPRRDEPLPGAPHGQRPQARRPAPPVDPDDFARDAHGTAAVTAAWAAAAIAAIGLPFLWGRYPAVPPLPTEIAALQEPGKVTLVGFTDFECPFCRLLHPELHALEEQYGDRLRLLRKMMPLPRHHGALPAAKAYLCTPEAQRPAAANLLYGAPAEQLEKQVAEVLAPLRLDRAAFETCLAAPETQAAINADMALYERLAGRGLPFTIVGRRVVLGYNPERIAEILRLEMAGDPPSLPIAGLFAALFAVAALAATVTLASKGKPPAGLPSSTEKAQS